MRTLSSRECVMREIRYCGGVFLKRTCFDEAQSILKRDVPSRLSAYKTGSRQTLLSRLLFSERSSKCLTSLGPTDVKDDRRDPPSPG